MTVTTSCPPTAAPIGILLVDDQPSMLWGLEMLIDGESPHMVVVGKATDRAAVLQIAAQCTRRDVGAAYRAMLAVHERIEGWRARPLARSLPC